MSSLQKNVFHYSKRECRKFGSMSKFMYSSLVKTCRDDVLARFSVLCVTIIVREIFNFSHNFMYNSDNLMQFLYRTGNIFASICDSITVTKLNGFGKC